MHFSTLAEGDCGQCSLFLLIALLTLVQVRAVFSRKEGSVLVKLADFFPCVPRAGRV